MTPQSADQRQAKQAKRGENLVKSPSDTTIYVPALSKAHPGQSNLGQGQIRMISNQNRLERLDQSGKVLQDKSLTEGIDVDSFMIDDIIAGKRDENINTRCSNGQSGDKTDIMCKISNFVDQLRLDFEDDQEIQQQSCRPKSSVTAPGLNEAQKHMEQALVKTEKFKAAVEKPPGRTTTDIMLDNMKNFCSPHNDS